MLNSLVCRKAIHQNIKKSLINLWVTRRLLKIFIVSILTFYFKMWMQVELLQ